MEKAARTGDARSMAEFGRVLEKRDPAAGLAWLERAAWKGDLPAKYNLGLSIEADDPVRAMSLWAEAADGGFAPAMYMLGRRLELESPDQARADYEKATDLANKSAAYALGMMDRREGRIDEARRHLERAAELGEPRALFALGSMRLAERDPAGARRYFRQAKAQGYWPGLDEYDRWYQTKAAEGSRRAKLRAVLPAYRSKGRQVDAASAGEDHIAPRLTAGEAISGNDHRRGAVRMDAEAKEIVVSGNGGGVHGAFLRLA